MFNLGGGFDYLWQLTPVVRANSILCAPDHQVPGAESAAQAFSCAKTKSWRTSSKVIARDFGMISRLIVLIKTTCHC